MRTLSMALAGTDVEHHHSFVTAAEGYRRDIQRVLNHDIEMNSRDGQNYEAGASLWAQVPAFSYELPSMSAVLRNQSSELALLAGWLLVAIVFALTGVGALRVD